MPAAPDVNRLEKAVTLLVMTVVYGALVSALTSAGIVLSLVVAAVIAVMETALEGAHTAGWTRADHYLFSFAAVAVSVALWVALP